jgi:predicted RNA-binding Zn-ribbon protein involved in translation (DUF1610 family)
MPQVSEPDVTESSSSVICPFCENRHRDPWEVCRKDGREGSYNCEECGKEFICWVETTYSYWAKPPDADEF